jgi:hypothetical protein
VFDPRPVCVGFVVDIFEMVSVLRIIRCFPANTIPLMHRTCISISNPNAILF